jgi:SpoIVB peptidase S55
MGRTTRSRLAGVAAAFGLLLWAHRAPALDTFPLEDLRPGMIGVGRTVFEGARIDEFKVTILGILDNALGAKQSLIIARLEGGPLEKTGVIAGMSGSPVFVDGKLVGAVSYSFPFAKETIGGITPIGSMIEATNSNAPRPASARFAPSLREGGFAGPLDRDAMVAALERPLRALIPSTGDWHGTALPGAALGSSLMPVALPLVFGGFDPSAFAWARGVFSGLGFAPVMATGAGAAPDEPLPPLQPGSALGVSLVEGDLDLSVTGTVTYVDKDRVYAFGHPFYNLGPTQFPMKKAYVYSIFPSLYSSFKISTTRDVVGTMDQDRFTAIAGHLGAAPRMIPVSVNLSTSRGADRHYSFRIVEDELFSPVLAYVSLLSVLQGSERAYGTSTIRVDARVTLGDGREVRVDDLFTEGQPAVQASALVAAPLAYLLTNDFAPVSVEKLVVDVSSFETIQSATLQRVWMERSGPVRPGATVPLRLQLRTYRGDVVTDTIPVQIPSSATPGTYSLLVADSQVLTGLEQREMRQPFVPKDLDQLIRAINGLRRNNHVYSRLMRADSGAIVSGEFLQSLPPSVLSVLGAEPGSGVVPLRSAAVWDNDLPTDYAITGSRLITFNVER